MTSKRVALANPNTSLRERAEAASRASRNDIATLSPDEIQRLVQELQVHQIELEMQNEELRRAQEELAQSRDRFSDLYDLAPVGYATLDDDGTVLEANLTLAAMLGVERNKLVGRKFTRFVARAAQDTLYLHQRAVLVGDVKQACDLGLHRPADGKTFTARIETICLRDAVSGARHYRSAFIDITERVRAEEALAESEGSFRAYFENSAVGAIQLDPAGRFIRVNDRYCAITGYRREELLGGMAPLDLDHPEDREADRAALAPFLRGEVSFFAAERRCLRKDGEAVWVHVSASLVRDAAGAIRFIAGVVEDITARKHGEGQLRWLADDLERQVAARTAELTASRGQLRAHAERLHEIQEEERGHLARELHDEFGAAFTALKFDLHWIMARLPEGVEGVEEKARVMANLIDNSVESVRRTATLLRPRLLDDFGLVAAIEWQTADFQRRTGIRCATRLPEEVDLDRTVATALFRILQETLTNVARHAKATEVDVCLQQDGAKILLEVKDNGIGIGHSNISSEKSIGLFGMQERACAFGGQVRFESRPQHGARVIVEIPIERSV